MIPGVWGKRKVAHPPHKEEEKKEKKKKKKEVVVSGPVEELNGLDEPPSTQLPSFGVLLDPKWAN